MSFPHYDLVERAHAELLHEGKIKKRATQEEVEQDKGLLTRRAGYYVFTQRDPTVGLLEKTSGNNSLGFSVDTLLDLRGTWWDIATDRNMTAVPENGGPSGPDPDVVDRWSKPTAALGQIEGNGTDPGDSGIPDGEQIPYDEAKSIQFGQACNAVYIEGGAPIDPGMISVHSQRCAWDYYVARMPWPECLHKHVNEFRAVYNLPPV